MSGTYRNDYQAATANRVQPVKQLPEPEGEAEPELHRRVWGA